MKNLADRYFIAQEQIKNIKKFYAHLVTFILVNLVFLSINYQIKYIEFPWVLCGTFGWGIGLAFDYLKAFNKNPFLGRDWEERKIKEILYK